MTRWRLGYWAAAVVVLASAVAALGGPALRSASAAGGLGNCASSGYPALWPNGGGHHVTWGQDWNAASLPSTWYPFSGFYPSHSFTYRTGDTTDRLQSQLTYPGTYVQLNNAVGGTSPGYVDDAGIGTLAPLNSGPSKGPVYYAWCERTNGVNKFDTVAEVQESGSTWPPEVAFAASPGTDGVGSHVSVHVYWTTANGDYADGVPCGGDCNVHGLATWPSPAGAWNEFAVSWSQSDIRVYELFGTRFVLEANVTDAVCGAMADGPGFTEPCVPDGSNFQWTFQQNSLDGVTTVSNTTDPTGLAWVANYS